MVEEQVTTISSDRWLDETRRLIGRDAAFYGLIGGFIFVSGTTAALLGRTYLLRTVCQYVETWTVLAVAGIAVAVSPRFGARALRERPERPLGLALEVLREFLAPNVGAGMMLYLALAAFMGAFTTLKTVLPSLNGFWADSWLAQIDRVIHGGYQPWQWLHPWLGHRPLTRLIEIVYGPVWLGCITLIPLFFCVTRRHPDHRRRFLIAFILTWMFNGIVLAGVFMSGGPAFYGLLMHDETPFGELMRYLNVEADTAFSAAWAQHQLWMGHRAAVSGLGAGISDFPSLHVSMIILCCLGMWRIDRRIGSALLAVAVVIVVGSVHLGWHYAVGDYVVVVLMMAIWRVSGPCAAALRPRVLWHDRQSRNRRRPEPQVEGSVLAPS